MHSNQNNCKISFKTYLHKLSGWFCPAYTESAAQNMMKLLPVSDWWAVNNAQPCCMCNLNSKACCLWICHYKQHYNSWKQKEDACSVSLAHVIMRCMFYCLFSKVFLPLCSCTEASLMSHPIKQFRVQRSPRPCLFSCKDSVETNYCMLFIPTTRPSDVRLVMILHAGSASLGASSLSSRSRLRLLASPPSALHVNNSIISPAAKGSSQKCPRQTWKAKQHVL